MALRSLERARSDDERPWLIFVAPTAPHLPIDVEPKYSEAPVGLWRLTPALKERDRSDKRGYVRTYTTTRFKSRKIRRKQLRSLMSVDDMVDRLLEQLDHEENADTLAIFMSDNWLLWGHHRLRHKSVPYKFAVKIPFLMRWPGRVAAGIKDDSLVANIVVAPTVLDAASLITDAPLDGMSLLDRDASRDRLLIEYWKQSPDPTPTWAGTLTRLYQYVEYFTDADHRPDEREYYDLAKDPGSCTIC